MIFASLFSRQRSRLGRDKRREWVKELQAEPSRESFDDNSTGTAEGDTNVAGQALPESRRSQSAYRRLSGFRKCPVSVVEVLVPTSKATFQCTGSNRGTDADLIPLRRDFGPLGIKDLRGKN